MGSPDDASRKRLLTFLIGALLLLLVAHGVDHVVNKDRLGDLPAAFWVFLPFQYGAYVVALVLLVRGSRHAPAVAAALAAAALLAFTGAHLVPFGPLPYSEANPGAISWALVFAPMAVAAAALAVALMLRRRGEGERHPVATA